MTNEEAFQEGVRKFGDVRWRLNNLYFITDDKGKCVPFRMNWGQQKLLDDMHYCNIVLKARQIGFTTFLQLFMLDACVFNSNIRAGTIAHNIDSAKDIFRDKVKFPYSQLPEQIRQQVSIRSDNATEMLLSNNSALSIDTSHRSGTLQYLHISEHGKICAKYPDKAQEVRTGALNTVQAGQMIFIESTAEGQSGDFFKMCEDARTLQRRQVALTPLDFKFHFFPWWQDKKYAIDASNVEIPDDLRRYFKDLDEVHGIPLSAEQKAWYVKKQASQQQDMFREYPSYPDEAFKSILEGAIFGKQLYDADRKGRITSVPHDPALKVNTWWDLGRADSMAIWFWQQAGKEIHFIDYIEHSGEDLPYYAEQLQERRERNKYIYGRHSWPHDGGHKRLGQGGRALNDQFYDLGYEVEIQPRYDIAPTITRARNTLPLCWFDAEKCSEGLKALRNYRYEWNEDHACWRNEPLHDWASHGASAFRCGAMATILDVNTNRASKPGRRRYTGDGSQHSSGWAA